MAVPLEQMQEFDLVVLVSGEAAAPVWPYSASVMPGTG